MPPAMPCRISKTCKHGESRAITNEFKSKVACILEATLSTRLRMGESLPNHHEDHIAGKGDNSLHHYTVVDALKRQPGIRICGGCRGNVQPTANDTSCQKNGAGGVTGTGITHGLGFPVATPYGSSFAVCSKGAAEVGHWQPRVHRVQPVAKPVWLALGPKSERDRLEEARNHMRLTVEVYWDQVNHGRWFLHEHSVGATFWFMEEVKKLQSAAGVCTTVEDQCQWGLKTRGAGRAGSMPARKRTKFMTNSSKIAN